MNDKRWSSLGLPWHPRRRARPEQVAGTPTSADPVEEDPALSAVRDPGPAVPVRSTEADDVTPGVRIAAAWSWRLIVIAAALGLAIVLVVQLRLIVIPLLIAVLVSALLVPFVSFLVARRWPKGIAIAVAMIVAIGIVSGLLWLAVQQITSEFPTVRQRTVESYRTFTAFLLDSPLHITSEQLNGFIASVMQSVQEDGQALWSGALSVGSTLGHVVTGVLLALFSLLFILIDGRSIWSWVVRILPTRARPAFDGAGRAGWHTLVNYARTQILVATIDAVGIGAGAFLLGLPLAIPIAVLVFLGSFVPIVGAVLTGSVAVFIALVYNGPGIALAMLAVVLGVQQLEGHVLQPLLMGAAVKVHPLAVVLVVAAGSMLAGIPGALFAVPIAAVVNVMIGYIASGAWRTSDDPLRYHGDVLWQTVPRQPPRPRRSRRVEPSGSAAGTGTAPTLPDNDTPRPRQGDRP
ncbi:AI-2E family transporter [Labedella phragmitis]|uniref:AI-2E family transporter n=1 Tax=Labedella phragmitis TaxID=2498849 RepID=UPI001FB7DE66|nr:AI-2E family transporter [Labedella phragmitis]